MGKVQKVEPRLRARLQILNYLAAFCMTQEYSGGHVMPASKGQRFSGSCYDPPVGALVSLSSAPFTKWYLSWVVDVKHRDEGPGMFSTFGLESIEDGTLCNWTNVNLHVFDPETVAQHPEWRWSDRQHEFNDRWIRACRVTRDAYITLPVPAAFDPRGGVTLATRTRFGLDDHSPSKHFADWRAVRVRDMLAFYDEAVAAREKAHP